MHAASAAKECLMASFSTARDGVEHVCSACAQCWEACIADEACGMWVWCSGKAGCDENGNFNGRFPYRSAAPYMPRQSLPIT